MSRVLQNELELSPAEKRALLSELLKKKAASPRKVPLSFAQQRLWLLAQLEPDSAAYNISRALHIEGDLIVAALRETINRIVARHEVLRGSFDLVDGEPRQLISPERQIDLPVTNLETLSESDREKETARLVAAEAQRPFDLSRDPLLRVSLIKLGEKDHVLLLTMHHVVSDGWSMGILVKEMAAIYQSIVGQRPVDLPKLPIQYSDFARWQRESLQGEVLEELSSYWEEQLAGAPPVLDLPIARQRSATQTMRGAHISRRLLGKLSTELGALSRREGVTLFMTLFAAFQTLLYRYSGQEDLVTGSPIAGRNRAETEDLIGFFVNSLPLRTNVSGNPSFRELLGRVKETALGAYAHQDLPFEKIVEEIQPERSLSYSPIFQVMFALQNQPRAAFSLPELKITLLKREFDAAKFDLTLFMTETENGLECWLDYNTDLFESNAVDRLLEHYEILLTSIVANPSQRIGALQMLKPAEEHQLLVEWNETRAEFPAAQCVHDLFEEQAAKSPEAIALVCGEERLTYDELNGRANQLARYLQRLGVGPEKRVGVCLGRSTEMVIAVLAILKAGGAYVPLDPAYPAERLAFILNDANASVLLTDETLAKTLPQTDGQIISIKTAWPVIAKEDSSNPASMVQSRNLAYVIYTSGSTGQPKGVAIEHRSTVAFLHWALSSFTAEELSGVLFSTSLCFDLSVFELFAPLCAGGKVILVENALSLAELDSDEVTLVNTVPSAMTELVRLRGIPSSARIVNLAGEPLLNNLVQDIYGKANVEQVLNLYGPSEDTTYSTFARLLKGATEEPSIGRPVSNTSVYLLDSNLQLVPVGVLGELHLSGAGLARGYLDRAEMTAEKFIPNPFSTEPGVRMYKTGDLARYQTDGTIQFLGRIDHQIKLRGYRIELGEIETILREHAAVQNAVVMMRDSPQGNKDLVAYVVADSGTEENLTGELRGVLKQKLPDYMAPSYFVYLEQLPLTPNGKIDRRALPAPDRSRPEFAHARSAPRNHTEEQLARIWQQVLDIEQVGITDNFFELGGHSLLAVRLLAEIEKTFGQKIPLVSLFRNATIESLAVVLGQDVDSLSWPTLVEIQKGNARPPLFCVSMPNVNALGYVALARYLGPEQPVYGLQAQYPEDLQGEHSQTAVDELATEYLQAIRAVQPHGPYQFVGMCRGAHIAFEMARRLEDEGQEVALVGILDTWVMENTYNKFLYVRYYARRLQSFMRRGELQFIKKTLRKGKLDGGRAAPSGNRSHELANPMKTYFPGPDFQPKTYRGRVSVFRARRQPLDRIRDKELGWNKLALGGVDLHYVPGKHGVSVLREPHVRLLADELKRRLAH
jgi:amino acid adenylation domain-containing protein